MGERIKCIEEQFIVDVDLDHDLNNCVMLVYGCRGHSKPRLVKSFTGKEAVESYERLTGLSAVKSED